MIYEREMLIIENDTFAASAVEKNKHLTFTTVGETVD